MPGLTFKISLVHCYHDHDDLLNSIVIGDDDFDDDDDDDHLAVTLDGEDKVLARSSPDIDVRRRLLVKVARVHYCPVQ